MPLSPTTPRYSPYFSKDKDIPSLGCYDVLGKDLKVLFVGINPGLKSAERGHHYAGPTNHFWPCLSQSGLVDEPMTWRQDIELPDKHRLGFTNLTARPSRSASDLTLTEQRAGIPVLNEKIQKCRPKVVCFVGKGIYEIYKGGKCSSLGLQPDPIPLDHGVCDVFVMPSTSGIVAAYSRQDKLGFFKRLGQLVYEKERGLPITERGDMK
ncbi:uracil-DNA glycosylase-like protein [Spinellus fusiger]|nr:uracil-DNA glycosylase-like protein [Spinellus fusiger]